LESLPHDVAQTAVKIEAGSADGIAEDVLRLVSNIVARHIRDLVDQFRSALAAGNGTDGIDDTLAALREGRVGTLLVHDDGDDGPTTEQDEIPAGARVVDAAVALALRTDAQIVVVPRLAAMPGPIAALLRW
jgi:stalled ribosome rescue protein Dom34